MTKFKQAFNITLLTIVFGWLSILSCWAQQTFAPSLFDEDEDTTLIWEADSSHFQTDDSIHIPTPEALQAPDSSSASALQPEIPQPLQPEFVRVAYSEDLPEALKFGIFSFYLNSNIHYQHVSQFRTEEGLAQYIEGWKQEQNLKRILAQTDSLRKIYDNIFFDEEREKVAQQLLDNEMQVMNNSQLPEASYVKAREAELNWWKTAPREEFQKFSEESSQLASFIESLRPKPVPPPPPVIETLPTDSASIRNDSLAVRPTPAPVAPQTESTVIYKVQIGTFTKTVPPQTQKKFDKLAVLRRIDQTTDEKGTLIFSVGELNHFNDAVNMQNQIRQEGIKDAFVVSYLNGKRIPLNEAKKISEK
jgi:hypothetical protein